MPTNEIDANVFRKMLMTDVQDNIRQKALANVFANIHSANKFETIRNPYTNIASVGTGSGFVNEVDVKSWSVATDTVTVTDFIYTSESTENIENYFTDLELGAIRRQEMADELRAELDAKVIRDARAAIVAAGGNTLTAVTDATTAQTLAEDSGTAFDGFENENGTKVLVMNNNTLKFFKQAGAARVTAMGDEVFFKGDLYELNGFLIYATRKNSGQGVEILPDGAVIAAVNKPFDVYTSEMEFKTRPATASANTKVALEDIDTFMVYVATAFWSKKHELALTTA